MLEVPAEDLRALASGESIVTFLPAGAVAVDDQTALQSARSRPANELKPAYRRWATDTAATQPVNAVVVAVHPMGDLDRDALAARHVLAPEAVPSEGEMAILRVQRDGRPVLSDGAFAARLRSVEQALG